MLEVVLHDLVGSFELHPFQAVVLEHAQILTALSGIDDVLHTAHGFFLFNSQDKIKLDCVCSLVLVQGSSVSVLLGFRGVLRLAEMAYAILEFRDHRRALHIVRDAGELAREELSFVQRGIVRILGKSARSAVKISTLIIF